MLCYGCCHGCVSFLLSPQLCASQSAFLFCLARQQVICYALYLTFPRRQTSRFFLAKKSIEEQPNEERELSCVPVASSLLSP